MFNESWLNLIQQQRAIAVIRASKLAQAYEMAMAVAKAGMQVIEITWNSDRPEKLIKQLRTELPTCSIGAGTLLTLEEIKQAITCGAQFLFTPHINPVIIQTAMASKLAIIPGALTPTEIVTAWHLGATCVKVFPVQAVGGSEYIQSLQAPLAKIPLIPTGGVTLENAQEFLSAGAIAVGLSSQLFPKQLVAAQDWQGITQRASNLMERLSNTKTSIT